MADFFSKSNAGRAGKGLFLALILIFLILAPAAAKGRDQDLASALKAYRDYVLACNPDLDTATADVIVRSIVAFSYKYGIGDVRLVVAIIVQESCFRTDAVSHAGAMGLGQLMPETAEALKVENPFDPVANIEATVRILRLNLERFAHLAPQQQVENALAAYNAGYGAVLKYGGIPPYPETLNYVRNVIVRWRRLCGLK